MAASTTSEKSRKTRVKPSSSQRSPMRITPNTTAMPVANVLWITMLRLTGTIPTPARQMPMIWKPQATTRTFRVRLGGAAAAQASRSMSSVKEKAASSSPPRNRVRLKTSPLTSVPAPSSLKW